MKTSRLFFRQWLAMVGDGEYASVEEATAKTVKIKDVVLPDAHLTEKYKTKYSVFKRIYPALKGIFEEI